ncbi:putative imp-specific 5nucleotidase [Phaeomoniella chlamydospora]|uniref:IMP-specific 5'-nucleotidase 1 n=1 Tax=Phaeomoniella chlamydospora TaxID=158046 RepID=A0A0G2E7Q8_PHACM|nr:putative imp-specific 5nucleotidase [Phaeomoniella chlamydospora]
MLVPSVGTFFTPLRLEEAFIYQDAQRAISSRRFVAPSFNDIRLILNTAQVLSLVRPSAPLSSPQPTSQIKLLTFDGDVTLYDDGASLTPDNPVIQRLIHLLSLSLKIGIVTAAGYTEPAKYYSRLHGLLDAINSNSTLTPTQKTNLVVMGGESNFLFVFDPTSPSLLRYIRRRDWILPAMQTWSETSIQSLLTVAEQAFQSIVSTLSLPASPILRKERAVGIYPAPDQRFTREQLEETVLVVQQVVEQCDAVRLHGLPFCAFNGGNDVFVDIGDKSWGVMGVQKWFGGIEPRETLHVGDQFLSAGANDFKARLAGCTAWIANPRETVGLLDEILELW